MSLDLKGINWREQVFPKRENLGDDLTSIDYLKTAAIILMIVDHVGWLLFPQIEWFRVAGRLCVPMWFFLIGYADSRDVPTRWLVAGVIVMFSSLLVGLPPLALPILFTFALTRVAIDPFWRFCAKNRVYFWWIILLLVFFGFATDLFVEYGTMGFVLALGGYAMHHRERVEKAFGEQTPERLMVAGLFAFGALQSMKFGFSLLAIMVLFAGLIGVYFVLHAFKRKTFEGTGDGPHAPLIRFMGRYTLEIYVIHLLILKGVFGLSVLAGKIVG